MKPNYKEVYAEILSWIEILDDERKVEGESELKYFFRIFRAEYGFMIARIGEQKALAEYLGGLPSTINIPFYNEAILNVAKSWGSLAENCTEKQEGKILANWFLFVAHQLLKMNRK